MKAVKKLFMTAAVLLLAAVLAIVVCAGLVLTTVNDDKFGDEPSDDLPYDMLLPVLKESGYTASEQELNAYIAYLLDKHNSSRRKKGYTIANASVELEPDGCVWYVRISDGSRDIDFSAKSDAEIVGGEIRLRFYDVTAGVLPVPDEAASFILKRTQLSRAEDYFDADTLTARFPAHYGIEVGGFGELIGIEIGSLTIGSGTAAIETNNILLNMIGNIAGHYGQEIIDFIADHIDDVQWIYD